MAPTYFGQAMKKKSSTRYQRQMGHNNKTVYRNAATEPTDAALQRRRIKQAIGEQLDQDFQIEKFVVSERGEERRRRGWLYNISSTTVTVGGDAHMTSVGGPERAGLDLYFCTDAGSTFKSTILHRPYFYVLPDLSFYSETDVILELMTSTLLRLLEGSIYDIQLVYRIDLDQPNHLSPRNRKGRPVLKLIFDNVSQLVEVREQLKIRVQKNQALGQVRNVADAGINHDSDPLRLLMDLREYDVPYVVRACTDLNIRVGTWYTVELENSLEATDEENGGIRLLDPDRESKANPTFLAFDIECTKAPLKFPSQEADEIFMISYMVSTPTGCQGYLIVSRSVVSADIDDFEYTPKPNYPGPFTIFNVPDEKALLQTFFDEFRRLRPQIVVTYNGDFFDWPFLEARANVHRMDMYQMVGVEKVGDSEYRGRCCVHMDAFHWVQRDSYLPQGSQGLKAVTRYKLGYDPVEVDPEDMVRFAQERPVHMATYSVSDAVATYYLYEKYVHLFIFSLCTIIPMGPEDVLRKGSGTLCETLLMVQACEKSIICPNKQVDPLEKFHNGHLLESETYIGGKVECLETGVYRSDIEYEFDLTPSAFQYLIDNIDRDLTFAIEVEGGLDRKNIENYDEIRSQIIQELEMLRDQPKRVEKPYIYHLDVGAMYPNIILTNRLQPSAIVDDTVCAACDFNQSKNNCKRRMNWIWRGDYNPASRNEYERAKDQLSKETHRDGLSFHQLPGNEQAALVTNRLKIYSKKAYMKTKITEEEVREDIVCMRENDFYVDTVRQFRDRRYEYKKLNKTWKKKSASAKDPAMKKQCEDRVLVYDSLQVAHKCILNSFYGYVMRKGARWRSMEMAGIVTKTGADIITQARRLVEQIGRPLELDTDGIWCILPRSFPDVYTFTGHDGGQLKLEYPCIMLNAALQDKFTNHQYQTLVDPERGLYKTKSECSIFFEVDGPYRCMVLPASTEEGKLLKKRYAVFNFDGSLAELKGFELKRRGELELIKTFQSQVFQRFLEGQTLVECYDSVAEVANHWIDVIDTRGESLDDDELVDLISENRSMSRQLDDYGGQKGTSQTTARRLGEFLGAEFIKDKGLNCKFIIAAQPFGAPVTERAIPTAIWKADRSVMKHFLRKWLKSPGLDGDSLDIRNILDWDYYLDRLGKTIQKIITIPAALQKVPNPVPRVSHPGWLSSKVNRLNNPFKQQNLREIFEQKPVSSTPNEIDVDMEDLGVKKSSSKLPIVRSTKRTAGGSSSDAKDGSTVEALPERRVVLSDINFNEWLKEKKSIWRNSRKDRRARGGAVGQDEKIKRQRKNVSMEGFVREAALALSQNEWQIVEVREMSAFESMGSSSFSGELTLWAFIGRDSLQKINITIPRTIYISASKELVSVSDDILGFKEVEKYLPHGKRASFVYEVSMPEYIYRKNSWLKSLQAPVDTYQAKDVIEAMYESETPLVARAVSELGAISRLNSSDVKSVARKNYLLTDLSRVDRPSGGEYLDKCFCYKRVFIYVRINSRTRSGIVALYLIEGGSGSFQTRDKFSNETQDLLDITRPPKNATFDTSATCHIWIVKPGSSRGQKTLSIKQCQNNFSQLIEAVRETADHDSDYSCLHPESRIQLSSLKFVDTDDAAFSGANEIVNSQSKTNSGPSLILLNSTRSANQMRRFMSSLNSLPVLTMPFPPGPAHNTVLSNLPALNWEQPIAQLSLEAYLFAIVVSYPKRASYARYGHIPIGNLGPDENAALYDNCLSRLIQKNRALSWASPSSRPDLGVNFLPSGDCGAFPTVDREANLCNQDEIWGEDDDLVSPVIRNPGCYRSICVDIDVQHLAIAALTNSALSASVLPETGTDPSSPNNVTLFDSHFCQSKHSGPLGDEMSTAISLSLVRTLVASWLKDAFQLNSMVADELLHHIYRLMSNPDCLLHDPALHRVVHSLMKKTFMNLLEELQRLGCTIVNATFQRVTVATTKLELSDAQEYIDFVIATTRKRASNGSLLGDALARISLKPRQFHTHFIFLDEYNFGTMQLERIDGSADPDDFVIREQHQDESTLVASVVTAWSVMNYLGSDIAQEYFRAIIGRYSKDILRKQMDLIADNDGVLVAGFGSVNEELLLYKKKVVAKHFAAYLTRAVSEILNDGVDDKIRPPFARDRSVHFSPALEFVKNVIVVLELDKDVDSEVQSLKRSLLAQLGVAEYSKAAQWQNPCPSFILPDVFCSECQESRDVNLCYISPHDVDEEVERVWVCEECGTHYDASHIERRLIRIVHRKNIRYQLQDIRCAKSSRVAKRVLTPHVECSEGLQLDFSPESSRTEVRLMQEIAEYYNLDSLRSVSLGLLEHFSQTTA